MSVRFVSGGVDAKVVMTGLGSAAKQVWPSLPSIERTVTLAVPSDFEKLSYQGFDGRTAYGSALSRGIVNNGKFTPEPNLVPAYEFRALDQTFDGANVAVQTVVSANPTPLAVPSILILSVKGGDIVELVGVEYGSDGIRIVSVQGGAILFEQSVTYNIPAGATLRVERFLSWVQVYVNGIRIGAANHESFRLIGNPGVGVYSSANGALSTPVGPTKFFGGSSLPKTFGGMSDVAVHTIIPTGRQIEVMSLQVEGGRSMKAIYRSILWQSNSLKDDEDRYLRVLMNGVQVTRIPNTRGVTYQETGAFAVPEHAIFTVTGYVSTGASVSNRRLRSGSVEVVSV